MSTLGFDMYVEPLKLYLQKFREVILEGLDEELIHWCLFEALLCGQHLKYLVRYVMQDNVSSK